MQRIKILLASAERREGGQLEAMVREVCYEQAVVEVIRTPRIDELVRYGACEDLALIILAVDHLVAEPRRGGVPIGTADVVRALGLIRQQQATPILALAAAGADAEPLLKAGVDCVRVGLLLDAEGIKADLRRLLRVSQFVETARETRWSFGAWLRGYQRLGSA